MRFVAVTARGGEQTLLPSRPLEVLDEDARGATLRWQGASEELSLDNNIPPRFHPCGYG